MRVLADSYANANLNAAVTLLTKTGAGAQFNVTSQFRRVRIACTGNDVWAKLSTGNVVAAQAGLGGEILITTSEPVVIEMFADWDNLSIVNAGAGCKVSASLIDDCDD
jgi:hypothetical protein